MNLRNLINVIPEIEKLFHSQRHMIKKIRNR